MQNSPRNKRLMREALGNVDGEMPIAYGTLRAIAAAVLIILAAVALSAGKVVERSAIAASTSDAYIASVHYDAPALTTQDLGDRTASEVEVQPQGTVVKKEPEGNVVDMTY